MSRQSASGDEPKIARDTLAALAVGVAATVAVSALFSALADRDDLNRLLTDAALSALGVVAVAALVGYWSLRRGSFSAFWEAVSHRPGQPQEWGARLAALLLDAVVILVLAGFVGLAWEERSHEGIPGFVTGAVMFGAGMAVVGPLGHASRRRTR